MKKFFFKRSSIEIVNIFNHNLEHIGEIVGPKSSIWSEDTCPRINLNGEEYKINRKLVTNRFFANKFEYSLTHLGSKIIDCISKDWVWNWDAINFEEGQYHLKREKIFKFSYTLVLENNINAQFEDITPFLSFIERNFQVEASEDVDLRLLSFVFFIAYNDFF